MVQAGESGNDGRVRRAMKVEVLSRHKPSARKAAESHIKIHIIPYFGKLRLDSMGVENQQAFISHPVGKSSQDKRKTPLSHKTIMNVLMTLSSMLSTAKNWGYFCEGIDLRKVVMPELGLKHEARCSARST
jgi:Phage integrase, N-terminal SAM-like domain